MTLSPHDPQSRPRRRWHIGRSRPVPVGEVRATSIVEVKPLHIAKLAVAREVIEKPDHLDFGSVAIGEARKPVAALPCAF